MLLIMKYHFFCLFREKTTMFWSLIFPLLMCTFFYVTFGNIDHSLDCINVAVVVKSETAESEAFQLFLHTLEENAEDFIKTEKVTEKKAKSLLKDGKVCGIYYVGAEPELCVAGADVEESVLQSLMESYLGYSDIIQTVAKEKPEKLMELVEQVNNSAMEADYVKEASLGGKETDGTIQYFFSLIAMTCMFGCFLGLDASMNLQANVRPVGARRCVCAVSKMKLVIVDFFLICLITFTNTLVLLGYMAGILKLDLGADVKRIVLVSFMGCVIGTSMGMLVGSIGKWGEGMKIAIMLSVSLGSSFLSGLMLGGVKGVIEDYCPIVNRINPASLISDAFYSLSVYPDSVRYTRDILLMAVWAVIFLAGSFMMMRRVKYDSI